MAILAADKDKEIKTLFLKYMAWNMLPLLYNDALKKLCKMGFSLAKATKLLKSMQENGEIEIVSNLHYFGNKRCLNYVAVPYLQIDNLTKSFGDLVLFENISTRL